MLLSSFLTFALYRGLWSALRTGRLTHRERQLITSRKGIWVGPRHDVHSVERRQNFVHAGNQTRIAWSPTS